MEVKLDGLDEALQNLTSYNLSEEIENKALTKAGKITQKAIQNEAPNDEGTLKKNIILKRVKDGEIVIHTGKAYHAHLIEFGRSGGSVVMKNGRRVTWGSTTPNPFFSRAYEESLSKVKQALIDEIQRSLGL